MQLTPRPRPLLLAILDGLALNPNPVGNAVYHAVTPTLDRLFENCPHTTLTTFGERVGLPEGQMGNSEVGHLNIGGGRIVQQLLTRINQVIAEDRLKEIPALTGLLAPLARQSEAALHLIGLLSLGGVHSQRAHLESLVVDALRRGVENIFIHAITDGRDRPPAASLEEVLDFDRWLDQTVRPLYPRASVAVVSIVGRYYAMDRDKRWERTAVGYNLFVHGLGEAFESVEDALRAQMSRNLTDEFLTACTIASPRVHFSRLPNVRSGDTVMFFNFRADRMRQLVTAFASGAAFADFERGQRPERIRLGTLTEYDEGFTNPELFQFPVEVIFQPAPVKNHLGAVLSNNGLTQLRIAETEKYAHVTYFFNGGEEEALPGEKRILIPSPRDVATYDLRPEMSAKAVTDALLEAISEDAFAVIILNYANCDMVGHTGNFNAAVKAVEAVDSCLALILDAISKKGGAAIVTADHGNADQMIDYVTGEPHTFHTTHPVPCIFVGSALSGIRPRSGGALCDIAPTICDILGLPQPAEMTGTSLCRG